MCSQLLGMAQVMNRSRTRGEIQVKRSWNSIRPSLWWSFSLRPSNTTRRWQTHKCWDARSISWWPSTGCSCRRLWYRKFRSMGSRSTTFSRIQIPSSSWSTWITGCPLRELRPRCRPWYPEEAPLRIYSLVTRRRRSLCWDWRKWRVPQKPVPQAKSPRSAPSWKNNKKSDFSMWLFITSF